MTQASSDFSPRVIISGGGTGGHIFPALSIADAVKRRWPSAKILFVGAENRMEMERVPAAGYDIVGLPVAGFDRKHLWRNFRVLYKLIRSYRRARRIIRDFKPDIVVGVGGYASGPTLKCAQHAEIPTLIQEQNSYPGVTNKMLAPGAGAICVAYPGLERFFPADKIVMTGNPVRRSLLHCELTPSQAKEKLAFPPDKPLVLIVGGSLGARTLNEAVSKAVSTGRATACPFSVLWQTGKNDEAACMAVMEQYKPANVRATAFISDMAVAYRAADLVVARAGAGTISELELLDKAVILVPSPNVAEDHQRHNALALAERGAAIMVLDKDAADELWGQIELVAESPDTLRLLSEAIRPLACPDSDEKIVDQIARLIHD